jgi:uncharacterized membrane protein
LALKYMKRINDSPVVQDITDQINKQGYWKSEKTQYTWEAGEIIRVSKIRSIYKTISWRILATTDTFIISWLITGFFHWAISIASIEVFTKMFLYYFHERAWHHVKFKRPW